jgi:tetratricopeptide (TPR) repeat protein
MRIKIHQSLVIIAVILCMHMSANAVPNQLSNTSSPNASAVYALGEYDPRIGSKESYDTATKLSKEGKDARIAGHYAEAIEKQSQAIKIFPSANHYYARGLAYFGQGVQAETDHNQQLHVASLKHALQDLDVARTMHRDWRIPALGMKIYDHLSDIPEFPKANEAALKAVHDSLCDSYPSPPPEEREKLLFIEKNLKSTTH